MPTTKWLDEVRELKAARAVRVSETKPWSAEVSEADDITIPPDDIPASDYSRDDRVRWEREWVELVQVVQRGLGLAAVLDRIVAKHREESAEQTQPDYSEGLDQKVAEVLAALRRHSERYTPILNALQAWRERLTRCQKYQAVKVNFSLQDIDYAIRFLGQQLRRLESFPRLPATVDVRDRQALQAALDLHKARAELAAGIENLPSEFIRHVRAVVEMLSLMRQEVEDTDLRWLVPGNVTPWRTTIPRFPIPMTRLNDAGVESFAPENLPDPWALV
jgi:hypothetical protein